MGWLDALFGRGSSRTPRGSAQVAKQRLVEVLVYDHVKVTPDMLEEIRTEIARILSRHLEIDAERIEVNIVRGEGGDRLVANVPVRRAGTGRRAPELD
ncbi:MAG: cell division topological specificity factor MinE [Thermomicrobium sp.]|nr:cell division topological specificity factor MinE [Thermomicrobium sp.]MDW7982059.1 cell division topological specificity factor MinE [Thermomicrobium sp.]